MPKWAILNASMLLNQHGKPWAQFPAAVRETSPRSSLDLGRTKTGENSRNRAYEQASTHPIFVRNSSECQILRALLN